METFNQWRTAPPSIGLQLDPQRYALPFPAGNVQGPEQTVPFLHHNHSFIGSGDQSNPAGGEIGAPTGENVYQRVKWTDGMVKVMITALSYAGEVEGAIPHFEDENRMFLHPRKRDWRVISDVMSQKGYRVSARQCEYKFNDLNKKYSRLNELLGKGIACEVVENRALLGFQNLSTEAVVEVLKILACKQLYYQEMSSYVDRHRLHLPHDQSVQDLVKSALKGKGKCLLEVIPEEHGAAGSKRTSSSLLDLKLKLEEQKLQIKEQKLELKKLQIEEQREHLKLEDKRLENKRMKLENQKLFLKIRRQMSSSKVSFSGDKRGPGVEQSCKPGVK